jgi:hypothetical protein
MAVTATKPKRKYTRRKVTMSAPATEKPVPTESSFMEGMRKELTARKLEIEERIHLIEIESVRLGQERDTLADEHSKVEAGLNALDK